ncbi:hypothetical protein [Nocardia wallacei]|uniref:hypothetical protein n=1 Tax=Nocardia wallacei TaxID=480035 RepID=UPI002453AD9A|nr:hypothetical protein [Nocardia wallacei]
MSKRRRSRKRQKRIRQQSNLIGKPATPERIAEPSDADTAPARDCGGSEDDSGGDPDGVIRLDRLLASLAVDDIDDASVLVDEWEDESRYDEDDAALRLRLESWQFRVAVHMGLIPEHGHDGRWSQRVIDSVASRVSQILEEVGTEFPIGAWRGADRIADRLGVPFSAEDFRLLVRQGHLTAVSQWKGSPTYSVRDIDAFCDDHGDAIRRTTLEHQQWLDHSYSQHEAVSLLGWTSQELTQVLRERRIMPGKAGRYAQADIDALLDDDALDEHVLSQRVIGPNEAATHLGIRRRDFEYCVAAGWITPTRWTQTEFRGRTLDVALYKISDVQGLLEIPDVDWDAVRAVAPGKVSPLRKFAALPISRAAAIKHFAATLSGRYGVAATAEFRWRHDEWRIRWTPGPDGEPTIETVTADWKADPDLCELATSIVFDTGTVPEHARITPAIESGPARSKPTEPDGLAPAASWDDVQSKIVARLEAGRPPALSRHDAQALVTELRRWGVEPTHLEDPSTWSVYSRPWYTNEKPAGTPEHIAALCGRLDASVDHRFAVNLSKRDTRILLDFIAQCRPTQQQPVCLDDE